jgi:hypothetical protein
VDLDNVLLLLPPGVLLVLLLPLLLDPPAEVSAPTYTTPKTERDTGLAARTGYCAWYSVF